MGYFFKEKFSVSLERLSLIGWHFRSLWRGVADFLYVVVHDYRWQGFWKADLLLRSMYFFKSPFAIFRDFAKARGDVDPYTFGTTPMATLAVISREGGVSPKDKVYDLGCGTAQTAFWWALRMGCSCVGVDYLPIFIHKAQRVQSILRVPQERLILIEQDFFTLDYRDATFVYVYGTHLNKEQIESLIQALLSLPIGARVVTVSYPLTEYQKAPWFLLGRVFEGAYPWGKTSLYLHTRTDYGRPTC